METLKNIGIVILALIVIGVIRGCWGMLVDFIRAKLGRGKAKQTTAPRQKRPVEKNASAIRQSAAKKSESTANNTADHARRPDLRGAARMVFNNSFSPMVAGETTREWEEPVQDAIATLMAGGRDSVNVLLGMLRTCAAGKGGAISDAWWYGAIWAIRVIAKLADQGGREALVQVLRTDSNIAEWFTSVQLEAAKQLGAIGTKGELPALQAMLDSPTPMSPVNQIAQAIREIGGTVLESPAVILARAQNQLGDADGIEYLLSHMDAVPSWNKKDQGFCYFLLASKAKRLGHAAAARALFAAQVSACPANTSYGWQEFTAEGITPSPENAEALSRRYPVPRTMEAIQTYTA